MPDAGMHMPLAPIRPFRAAVLAALACAAAAPPAGAAPPDASALAAAGAPRAAPAGHSGLRLIVGGEEALAALIAMADTAQRTLDLKYYAVLNETSSRVVLQHVRGAADRGVRVRVLLDDLNTAGSDGALLRLAQHPNIEVRLYNPMPSGRGSVVTKVLGSLHDAARVNSRMHGKAFIADGALAMTGGRNLGDAYFLRNQEANFVDLDLLVAGPAAQALARLFDRFWHSELARPAPAVTDAAPAPRPEPGALDAPDVLPEPPRAEVEAHAQALRAGKLELQWAPARLVADEPTKSLKQGEPDADETMFDDLRALLRSAESEVLIVTPYFVPGRDGMALIGELRRRGVRVRVLTASLAGTDAPIVHAGYSRYRAPLLALGVELFELRPEFGTGRRGGVHSRTNLHAKAVVVDRKTVLLGSMNLDPRSDKHNTELGLLVRSPALADTLHRALGPALAGGAYRIARAEDGRLRWIYADAGGRVVELAREPRVPLPKRLGLALLAPLAPEEML